MGLKLELFLSPERVRLAGQGSRAGKDDCWISCRF